MAVNPVNLCADLQAWHSVGLSFLLFPDVDARALLNAPRAPQRVRSEVRAAALAEPRVSQKSPAGAESAPRAATPGQTPQKSASIAADSVSAPDINAKLPAYWEAILAKAKPAPVVWTYLELGEDLFVKGNPDRSRALKELIGGLGLRGGTSAFLPVTHPEGAQDGGEAWCFGAAFRRLNGRILISFGPEALALSPYAALGLAPFHEKIVQGRMVLCLPSFADILGSRERLEATKVFLRSAFGKFNIL